jgi:hypothetical protein
MIFLSSVCELSTPPFLLLCSQYLPTLQTPSTMEGNQPLQAFRSRSVTDSDVNIPTQVDPKTGALVVLWRDIQDVFENVKTIRNGKSLVPFVNENLER